MSDGAPGGGSDDAPGGVGEPANLIGITLYHNQARRSYKWSPRPSPRWSGPTLATIASNWVTMCEDTDDNGLVDHNSNASLDPRLPTYVGENIFGAGGTATAMQRSIVGRRTAILRPTPPTRARPTKCAATTRRSCGARRDPSWLRALRLPRPHYASTIVCDYGPGGNIEGQTLYRLTAR